MGSLLGLVQHQDAIIFSTNYYYKLAEIQTGDDVKMSEKMNYEIPFSPQTHSVDKWRLARYFLSSEQPHRPSFYTYRYDLLMAAYRDKTAISPQFQQRYCYSMTSMFLTVYTAFLTCIGWNVINGNFWSCHVSLFFWSCALKRTSYYRCGQHLLISWSLWSILRISAGSNDTLSSIKVS